MKKLFSILFVGIMFAMSMVGLTACKSEAKHYNFIIANATIPPVMASMSLWESDDTTYFWYGRAQTFVNVDKLEERFNLIDGAGENQARGMSTAAISQMANQIESIYRKNSKATFSLYVIDYGIRAPMKLFYEKGIPEKNFDVTLLEDGTGSYNIINGMIAEGEEKFLDLIDDVDDMIEKSKKGTYVFNEGENMDAYWQHTIAYATKDNVKMLIQYPELLNKSAEMDKYMFGGTANNKVNFVKNNLKEAFESLSEQGQNSYRNMIFDTETFDDYFVSEDKPILVFAGTSFGRKSVEGENIGLDVAEGQHQFEVVMDEVLRLYGNDYKIVYKGHPSWPISGSFADSIRWQDPNQPGTEADFNKRKAYFEAHPEISVAPAQSPLDVIMICYPGLYLGGYSSSLYMNAFESEIGQLKFFVTSDAKVEALGSPVDKLYNADFFKSGIDGKNPFFICPEYFATLAD